MVLHQFNSQVRLTNALKLLGLKLGLNYVVHEQKLIKVHIFKNK